MFPETFTTSRLRAKRLTEAHWPEICRMHTDPIVMAHLGGVRPADWSARYLERNLLHWAEHGFGLWILHERRGDAAIGRAVLRHLPVEGVVEVEVGYGFYEPFWGRGLASEVTTACLRLGHDILKLQTIVAVTSPDNHASRRVLERCGLAFERALSLDGVPSVLYRTQAGLPDRNPA